MSYLFTPSFSSFLEVQYIPPECYEFDSSHCLFLLFTDFCHFAMFPFILRGLVKLKFSRTYKFRHLWYLLRFKIVDVKFMFFWRYILLQWKFCKTAIQQVSIESELLRISLYAFNLLTLMLLCDDPLFFYLDLMRSIF